MKLKLLSGVICACLVMPVFSKSSNKNSVDEAESPLSQALLLSGSNRQNLEDVLSYYSNDSLKYKAACFLIENMCDYYFLTSPEVQTYYKKMNDVFLSEKELTNNEYRAAYHKAMHDIPNYPQNCEKQNDLSIISKDFLIKNIDSAFAMWQKNSHNFSFETFCNYVLPYRVNYEPLSNWRDVYISRYGKDLDAFFRKQYNYYFPYTACNLLNKNFNGAVFYPSHIMPDFSLSDLLNIKIGSCDAYSARSVAQLRTFGFPSSIDFVPQWGNRSMGHSWCVMFINDDYTLPFGVNESIGSQFDERSDLTMPKVYRQTFAHQSWLYEISHDKNSYVPALFRNDCKIDVTDKYVETSDVNIQLDDMSSLKDVRWAYLTVFDNRGWVPVAHSKIEGNKVLFSKMGRNIVYLLYVIDNLGKGHAVSSPFILDRDGVITYLNGDESHRESIRVSRKYKDSEVLNKYNEQLQHSMFVVSNDSLFKDSLIVATLDTVDENRYYTLPLQYEGKYKFFKFISPKDSHGNIAEIQLFDDGGNLLRPLRQFGGGSGTEGHNYNTVYDGNVLTSYSRIVPNGAWAAVELDAPVHLSKIRVHPRTDGNSINAGDKYQLFFWHEGHWHLLGEKVAEYEDFMDFDGVPQNALLLFHNATQGTEERIFTYANGKQIWW